MEQEKLERIKEEANRMGTTYYKFVEPYIVNIKESIGKGSYGEVWKGADIRTSELVAVKQISTKTLQKDPEKLLAALKNEIDIMKKVKHENIVNLYDVRKSNNNIYLFLELCNKGSLEDLIKKQNRLSEKETMEVARQVINGYKCLHSNGIMHRDLKPANILIKDGYYKIADFGFAKFYEGQRDEERIHETLVGSPIYMCPQILNGTNYSTKCDVWSVGVILYELVYGRPPFVAKTLNGLIAEINKKDLKLPAPLSNKVLEDLIRRMLRYEEKDRPSWKDLFESDFVNPKKEDLEATLKHSVQMAEKVAKDKLGKSCAVNQAYFEEQKVVEKVDLSEQDQAKMQEVVVEKTIQPKETPAEQNDLFLTIAQKHEEQERTKQVIKRIGNYFLFKRNKAVFLNHLSLKLYECFESGLMQTELTKAEIILFVLSKYQCSIIYRSYIRLKEGKLIDCDLFSEEDFQLFIQSPLKQKLQENFASDFKVMKLFLDDLINKVKEGLKHIADMTPPDREKAERVGKICNGALVPKDLMAAIYTENITDLREIVRVSAKKNPVRPLLELGYFVTKALAISTFKDDKTNFNFFYEDVQKMANEQLLALLK